MNNKLNSVNIYYGDLNKLITECVTPIMDSLSSRLTLWFWERGCIGGKHLKVRWAEAPGAFSTAVKDELLKTVAEFQSKNPSEAALVYNSSAVKRLVEAEKRVVSETELEPRSDCAVEIPYERRTSEEASEELLDVLHGFLNDSRAFCTALISSEADRNLTGLRLMATFAIEQFGSLEAGCITFRAHWDNYENWFKPDILPARIKEHYEAKKTELHRAIKEIMEQGERGVFASDPVYAEWLKIIRKYRALVYKKQLEGVTFMPQPTTPQGVIDTFNHLREQDTESRSEQFLRRLYSEPDYLGSLAENKSLQMTRIMVNLVYHAISNLGVSAFERMSYCYFLHRSVEEILNIDILDTLDEQMKIYLAEKRATPSTY